jgi:hypothetical protein
MKRRRRPHPTTRRPLDIPELPAAAPRPRMVPGVLRVVELHTGPLRVLRTARRPALRTVRPLTVRMVRPRALLVARVRAVPAEGIPALVVLEAERGDRLPRELSPVIRHPQVGMKYMLPMVL